MYEKRFEYIQTVAQYGSILKASEKLYITPSALSKYIQKTEEELQVRLFDRAGKRFVLTYAGERYLSWMARLEHTHGEMMTEISDISTGHQGRIRVGLQLDCSDRIIDRVLPPLYKDYPKVSVEFYELPSHQQRTFLEEYRIDFAILPETGLGENLNTIQLSRIHKVIAIAKDHPLLKKAVPKYGFPYPWIDVSLLKDERFLVSASNPDSFGLIAAIPKLYGFTPYVVRQSLNFGASILKCVGGGLGVSICSDIFITSGSMQNKVEALSFGEQPIHLGLMLAWQKSHYLDSSSRRFMALCEQAYRTD